MAGHFSDDEYSVGHEADFVDASANTDVDVCLPLDVDRRSDPLQKDAVISSEDAEEGAVDLNQQEQHQFEPPNGARSKWPRHDLPLPDFLGSDTERLRTGVVDPLYPGNDKRQRIAGVLSLNREGIFGPGSTVATGEGSVAIRPVRRWPDTQTS